MNPISPRFNFKTLPRCAAKNRKGNRCGQVAINGKAVCYIHGGKSKGPTTKEGLSASRKANYKHGRRSKAHTLTIAQMNFDLYMANALIDNPKRVVTDAQEAWAVKGIRQMKTLDIDDEDSVYGAEPIRTKGML